MRYVSTRGEAPPLGFIEVTLAGLARDGGLYVPETWPRFRSRPDRRARRPALCRGRLRGDAAVRRRRDRRCRPRAHGAGGLRRVPPSGGRAAGAVRRPALRARAVSRPDARLQGSRDAVPRAADGSCAASSAASAPPSWSRPRAIPAAPRSRRSAAATQVDLIVLFPHGRISDVQRRMMTTPHDDERACARHRRHVRRLPGAS